MGYVFFDANRNGNKWQACIELPRSTGEPRRRVRRSAPSKEAAEARLLEMELELEATGTIAPQAHRAGHYRQVHPDGNGLAIRVPGGFIAVSADFDTLDPKYHAVFQAATKLIDAVDVQTSAKVQRKVRSLSVDA